MVQPFLLSTDADCLILLDCCYAAKGAKDSGTILRGTNEIIAACSPESRTTGVERRSFTSVLTRQLEEFAHAFRKCGKKFTAVGLHSALFRFSRELQYGPFYVRLTNSEYSSIDLTPLPQTTVLVDDDSAIHMGLSPEGSPGSESSSLNTKPKAVARVLVAIHLTKSPRGDLVGFLCGEGLIPSYVNAMEVLGVEAVFESNSVLAIISMPLSVWDLLPEDTPCSYIGITYSKNLLDSSIPPQSLPGLGPPKGEGASVPTHYHSLSEEKKIITGDNNSVSETMAYPKNQVNASCQTPLSWAAEKGHEAVVKLLLDEAGVEPNSKDTYGRTPLWWAAEKGHEALVKLLLDKEGVDPNSKDSSGQTPLSWAAEKGHEAVVKLLLDKEGVDPDSKDTYGKTPLSWAAGEGHEAVVKLLLDKIGVDPDSKDTCSQTPLWWAAGKGHEAVVKLLLDKIGVDPNSKDTYGQTPLSRAAGKGHEAADLGQQPQDIVQQQQGQAPLVGRSTAPLTNSAGENLQCQWQGCGERCSTPETLYVSISPSIAQDPNNKLIKPSGTCLRAPRRPRIHQ
jgi:ankyrin repeat protein